MSFMPVHISDDDGGGGSHNHDRKILRDFLDVEKENDMEGENCSRNSSYGDRKCVYFPSGGISNSTITNAANWEIHKHITVGKLLGSGSSGMAYQAFYDTGKAITKCVVKLPLNLMQANLLKIDEHGGIILTSAENDDKARRANVMIMRSQQKEEQHSLAVQNFTDEWRNYFMLHFGKRMLDLGMDHYEWKIKKNEYRQVKNERIELKHIRGFENIHRLLVFDPYAPLIISEYFDGTLQDLSQVLSKSDPQLLVNYMLDCIIPQTYYGLTYMHHHSVGLAHMDIKPMNMLYKFTSESQMYPKVVLCDFGFCQNATDLSSEKCGTDAFAAPEIFSREPHVPQYTDAHSWAVSMLWCFYPIYNNWSRSLVHALLSSAKQNKPTIHSPVDEMLSIIIQILDNANNPQRRYSIFQNVDKLLLHNNVPMLQ